MKFSGQLLKMLTWEGAPIQYYLNLSGNLIHCNQLIGRSISLEHIGYRCVECGSSEKIFRMGFCKKCFFESPYASESIIKPELSRAHLGEQERNLDIEKEIQLVPHVVYLAYTGDVKVGVTREKQVPTRWIDQGATAAIPIARTENRYQAGMIEVALKQNLADKTNYKKMLQTSQNGIEELMNVKEHILPFFPKDYTSFYSENEEFTRLEYPFVPLEKVNSLSLEKCTNISSQLVGIKGQYFCFEDQSVINLRSHEGYLINLTLN